VWEFRGGFFLDSRSHPAFLEKSGRRLRLPAAFYLVGFLLAVTAAPHHHLNPVADLLSDGPSDSGVVLEVSGPVHPQGGEQMNPSRLTQDEPCLACFHHDFTMAAAYWVEHAQALKPLEEIPGSRNPASPSPIPESPAARSPPRLV
jgi:hypothetical protein